MESAAINSTCAWCGAIHPNVVCPRVKALEYFQDGSLKRVEFKTASDYGPPIPLGGQHAIGEPFAGLPEHLHPNSNR